MEVLAEKLGRRYNRQWIFQDFDYHFSFPDSYAVLGPNGSGKSTLLQIISGFLSPSKGALQYFEKGKILERELVYRKISYSAPYIEIPTNFTVQEFIHFHFGLKGTYKNQDPQSWIEDSGLGTHQKKLIRELSTGLQQRVKLISALGANTQLVLLDEPTANLDEEGKAWFKSLFKEMHQERTIILGSNIPEEYEICRNRIQITNYKKEKAV